MKLLKTLFLVLAASTVIGCAEHRKFDSEQWKNWTESETSPSLRWEMHESLLEDYDLKSYSKKKIIDLLGSPNKEIGNEYYYLLGSAGSGIDTGTLIIKFKDDKAINIEILRG